MPRHYGHFLLLSAGCLGLWCALSAARLGPASRAAADTAPAGQNARWLGVGSCASMACHHGNGPRGSAGSEYSTWVSYDKHSRAYQVLFNEQSRRIVENLWKGYGKEAKAETSELCLKCHSMKADATGTGSQVSLSDGVGCESCHGPAERWVAEHYRTPAGGPEKQRALGMTATKDLRTRARVCTGCHVGDADREVNHDLIAAGHPRLNFEFGAYLANLEKHWREKPPNTEPDFEARVWAVGQVASLEAALKLLQARAAAAQKPPRKDAKPGERAVWPEFAEYDCYACHHGLRDEEWRRRDSSKRPAGSYPWGTWYGAMTPALAEQWSTKEARAAVDTLAALAGLMSQTIPDQKQVEEKAATAARQLAPWAQSLATANLSPDSIKLLLNRLARDERHLTEDGWTPSAQIYLAIAALHQAQPQPADRLALARHLQQLYGLLRFEKEYHSPKGFPADKFKAELGKLQNSLRP
jgi:hypothetical protein